jgi:hypothetical protein
LAKSKIQKETVIYVPILEPDGWDFKEIINELVDLSGTIPVAFNEENFCQLIIEKVSAKDPELLNALKRKKAEKWYQYVKFSSTYVVTKPLKKRHDPLWSVDYYTAQTVKHLLIYLNLAKPGSIASRQGVKITTYILGDSTEVQRRPFEALCSSIENIGYALEKLTWPVLANLKFKTIADWLPLQFKSLEVISVNRLGRALNAFSHLYSDRFSGESSYLDLMFAMIGIEALFVEGSDSVQRQVDVKSQLILGARERDKRAFAELYPYRSLMVHGQLNFANQYFVDDLAEVWDKHINASWKHSEFAICILIASIQKHIIESTDGFEFELILKAPK